MASRDPRAPIRFTKMHGTGNDYVFVDVFEQHIDDPELLARWVSDRHFGVGSDGLILIAPPRAEGNDCRMEMYNADGSRGRMCGNGIRCVARFIHDRRNSEDRVLRIETDSGVKEVELDLDDDGAVRRVRVDMGAPGLRRADVPMVDGADPDERAVGVPISVAGSELRLTAVSMGNPHAVVRIDGSRETQLGGLERLPIAEWGPRIERHVWFPDRTNVEFIAVRSPREIELRVWERGSGETLACGTGACAALVAASLEGWCERRATVFLRGGELEISWEGEGVDGPVFLSGPADEVFEGFLDPRQIRAPRYV